MLIAKGSLAGNEICELRRRTWSTDKETRGLSKSDLTRVFKQISEPHLSRVRDAIDKVSCWSGAWCASGHAYPDPYYKTTALVRFAHDQRGTLALSQDETCLKPLNKIEDIATARRALKKAGCT